MQQDARGPNAVVTEGRSRRRRPYRSLFWAIVLIGAGVIWLLFSADVLTGANARMLALLWPILLVGIGVDLLAGRRSLALSALVGVVTVGLVAVFMVVGPSAGWTETTELVTESRTVSVGEAASARISVDSGPYGAKVHALPKSSAVDRALLAAMVSYTGTLRLEATGDAEKIVTLATEQRRWWMPWLDGLDAQPWDIGLDAGVPLALDFQTGSGSVDLDLVELALTGLRVDVSSGDVTVKLPAGSGRPYTVDMNLSSGDLNAQAAADSRLDMNVDISSGDALLTLGGDSEATVDFRGSSGEFTLQLAAGQACRVEVRQLSSGDVHLPSGFVRKSEGEGKEGAWETGDYGSATHKVLLTIELSSGSVTVRR